MNTPPQPRDRRTRRRRAAFGLVLLAGLALPSSAVAAAFKLTPHIANHAPTINRKWPITVDVTKGKAKLSGSVKYEFMFSGTVVSTQKGHRFTGGVYNDQMLFPSNSVGQPLTLRILVTVPKYGTEHVDWKITPRK